MAGVMTATGLMGDCCVCCGRPVPEGVQVCKSCMEKAMKAAEYGWENVSERWESGSGPEHGCERTCAGCVNKEACSHCNGCKDREACGNCNSCKGGEGYGGDCKNRSCGHSAQDKAGKPKTAEERLLEYLKLNHTGKEKAVPSKDLERLFSLNGRTIRKKINKIRQDGKPVCSDQNGYYYAETQEDINKTIRWLNDLVTGVSNARTGLLFATLIPLPATMTITIGIDVE